MEQLRENWKKEKTAREEERKKDKEEWLEERRKLKKRLVILEWEKEKKDRERCKNNIVIRGKNEWGTNRIEQEIKEFLKENLEIEIQVEKTFKIQRNGNKCTVVAELESWEQKKEIMIKKKNLMRGMYIDNDLTRAEREMQEKWK